MTKRGVWQHTRSRTLYWVFGTAYEATNGPGEGLIKVLYLSMSTGKMYTRAEGEFHQRVHVDKTVCEPGTCEYAGRIRGGRAPCGATDRFQYMGEEVIPPGPMA